MTQSEASAFTKITNILKQGIKLGPKGDIAGGIADMMGSPIPKPGGGYWDHAQDLGSMLRGLRNNVAKLANSTDQAVVAVRLEAQKMIQRGNTVVGWTQLLSGVEFPDDVQFETAKYNSANDNVVLLFSQPYNGVQLSLPAFRPGVGSMRDFVLQNKVHVKTTISP